MPTSHELLLDVYFAIPFGELKINGEEGREASVNSIMKKLMN